MKASEKAVKIVLATIMLLAIVVALSVLPSSRPIKKEGALDQYTLQYLIDQRPDTIRRITIYRDSKKVLVDASPTGLVFVDTDNVLDLVKQAKTKGVEYDIKETRPGQSFFLRDERKEQFAFAAGLLGISLLVFFWRSGLLKKINLRMPGSDSVRPVKTCNYERCKFDDVAGCEEAVAKLRRVAKWLKTPEWYERFGAKIPKGILAVGPPGTGKTLLARALAGETDANFYSVDGSSFVEMFVGVGARRVRKLFSEAVSEHKRNGRPSIIFIDEIDAIGKRRGQGGSGSDTEREQTLNQLLICMQGFERTSGIIVMAATNIPDSLDPALTRPGRFDYRISVDLPDTYGREKIFGIHSRIMKVATNVRMRDLAVRTPQFSGADIGQACNEAAIAAAERLEVRHSKVGADVEIFPEDLIVTLEDFDVGIDYVQFGDPLLSRARALSEGDKRNTAYHEAGHSVVQQVLRYVGADPITKITIEPRTKSMGSMQSHAQEDRYTYTEEQLRARIVTAMGGRVAQEIFLGRKDTGAANDFEQATNMSLLMVSEFGMSKLEPMYIKLHERRAFHIGPDLQNEIDREWRRILSECYQQAIEIIKDNEERVERIANALLREQTLLGSRFLELWDEGSSPVEQIHRGA